MEHFLEQYGVLAVFLCAIIENDVSFILAGVVCDLGIMHHAGAVAAGVLGALIHDSIWFLIGHRGSETIRNHRFYQRVGPLVEGMARRFGPWELFFARFFYGTRNPSLLFWGIQRLPVWKFLALEILSLSIWGYFLVWLGDLLADRTTAFLGRLKVIEHYLLGGLILAVLVYVIGRLFTRRAVRVVKSKSDVSPNDLAE